MRKIVLITFLFSCNYFESCTAQIKQNETDFLKKYTYYILGFAHIGNSMMPASGSGFFIRKNNKLYLITAKHVFSSCDDSLKKERYYPDTMNVLILGVNGLPTQLIPIDISGIKLNSNCTTISDTADISVVLIPQIYYNNERIFSVENFLYPRFKEPGDIEIFGFPGDSNVVSTGLKFSDVSNIHIPKEGISFAGDKFNYLIFSPTIKLTPAYGGYSGSPVFLKDLKSDRWRVVGVFSGGGITPVTNKETFIVPDIDFALKYIDVN